MPLIDLKKFAANSARVWLFLIPTYGSILFLNNYFDVKLSGLFIAPFAIVIAFAIHRLWKINILSITAVGFILILGIVIDHAHIFQSPYDEWVQISLGCVLFFLVMSLFPLLANE
jgi:hypothetical protein